LWNGALFIAGTTEGARVSASRGSFDGYLLALDPGDLQLADGFPPADPFVLSIRDDGGEPVLSWPARKGYDYQLWSTTNLAQWIPHGDSLTPAFGFRKIESVISPSLIESNQAAFFRVEEIPDP
jgi:hypothetical protein